MHLRSPLLLAISLLPCAFLNTGCSTGRGNVTFTSLAPTGHREYLQDFPSAYISSNKAGEYDVVLINDDLHGKPPRSTARPLQPMGATPLTQALKIHVFWRPVAGVMLHESSVTNAIIDWYVFGSRDGRHVDLLHYQGAGFVVLHTAAGLATVTINDGLVAPTQSVGNIKDPVGRSTINGTIVAVLNDQRVKDALATLADQTHAAEHGGAITPSASIVP